MTTTLPEPFTVNGRYEITERPLGEGGMGVIYKAYDIVTKRFVALKTLWADASAGAIELFEREWTVLSRLSHPNIVDILDTGDWVFNGQRRPYFVMPLLPGRTLEEIVEKSGERLTVDRAVDIIAQACRGLQAAHDQNLVHRDIKPSNIFVMEDETVKIIDFGVVHLSDGPNPGTSLKGTPTYMAPEQLELKPATPLSDVFSLATVCYETLTGRKPFARQTPTEIAEAVRSYIPPAASEINPAVNELVSRTVHKAMAKQPWHRFPNAREFGDTLQRAFRNESIERFERSKFLPRIDRIKKAYSDGDYEFADEILRELESEGHVDSDMSILHIQIDQSLRQKNIQQLLENARIRMDEEEFPLALHKVEDALALEPGNLDAQTLQKEIEERRDETQLSHWFRLVHEHLENNLFGEARQGLQEVLKIDSSNTEAREMLGAIDETEQEIVRSREEKQRLYENAVESYRNGETSAALTHLERALSLARRSVRSSTPDLDAQCQTFYDSIRDERDSARTAYQEGRNLLQERRVAAALDICEEYLTKHPDDARFQALKLEAEELQRELQSAAVAEVSWRVDAEPDLDQKHQILQAAIEEHPHEQHFRSALKLIADRRDLVNAIVTRSRQYEERDQFADALGEMDIVRNIYPLFPGLDSEMERLTRRKEEQVRIDAKAHWLEEVDGHLNAAEYDKALVLVPQALIDFPADSDLVQRQTLAEQGAARAAEANRLLKEGQDHCAARNFSDGLVSLRKAERIDPRNRYTRAALLSGLVSYARELMPTDWHAAEPLVKEALDLEPTDPVARSLLSVLDDNRRQTAINIIIAGARNDQADGHIADALQILERGLVQYPNDHRLIQFLTTLRTQAGQGLMAAGRLMPTLVPEPPPLEQNTTEVESSPEAEKSNDEPQAEVTPKPAVPQQNFFAPPTTDIPFPAPPASPGAEKPSPEKSDALVVFPRALANRPKDRALRPPSSRFRPIPPQLRPPDPGLLEELRFKGPLWIIAVFAALALILSAGIYQLLSKSKTPASITSTGPSDGRVSRSVNPPENPDSGVRYPVSLQANADGTRFSEGDETLTANAQLAGGSHSVEAFHEGYLPETKTFSVDPAATAPLGIKFDLRPILPLLRLNSSIAHGRMIVDETESIDLESGVATKEDLPLGRHTVKIFDGLRQVFAFAFDGKADDIPALVSPLGSQPVAGVVVASLSGSARVFATAGLRASSALPVVSVPGSGLMLHGTPTNPAHFLLDMGTGRAPQPQSVDTSVFPTLSVQLPGANNGVVDFSSLSITTNASNCEVSVDGTPLKHGADGQVLSPPLNPGSHKVRLSCSGFRDMEKTAMVKDGQVVPRKLDFAMTPLAAATPAGAAQTANRTQLSIFNAPPDAAIFQNQVRIGTVGADGTFVRDLEPGSFTWEWRKPGFEPRKETRTVRVGDVLRLAGAMLPSTGSVVLKVVPDGALITVVRESDDSLINVANNVPVTLAAGSYRVSAQAPDYLQKTDSITIANGKPITLAWSLEKSAAASQPSRLFENGDTWIPAPDAAGWWIHPGTAYSSLRASTGTFTINFLHKKHSHKINILADCRSHDDCIVYNIDGHNLTTKVIADGSTVSDEKEPHGMDSDPSFHFVFEISADAITVKNQTGTILSSATRRTPGKISIQNGNPLKIN